VEDQKGSSATREDGGATNLGLEHAVTAAVDGQLVLLSCRSVIAVTRLAQA